MSVDKAVELRSNEIDKSKRRHRTDDTVVATAALSGGGDTQHYVKMESVEDGAGKPTELCLQGNLHLVSSTTSSLADTPGDSGVLCLDSEASEVTSQALMSHSLVGAEELACDSLYDAAPSCSQDMIRSTTSSIMTRSDIDNQNAPAPDDMVPELLVEANKKSPIYENLPDVVLKALESEKVCTENIEKPVVRPNEPKKSLSEDIVYRRKCRKKSQNGASSQKKRVSFHEDILNNTKTDNIHIERGFISYGPDSSYCDRFRQKNNIMTDRFSWCASGDRTPKYAADVAQQTMSDLLVYGDSKSDRSGVFEYCQNYDHENQENDNKDKDNNNEIRPRGKLYGCDSNSSDSNFSCDSETSSSDSSSSHSNKTEATLLHRKCDKAQKSYSCDGFENNAHVAFMRKTYFSEADIDQPHDRAKIPLEVSQSPNTVKSVLKKKRYITTNVVEERKQNIKVLNLLDANNIIDSLKSFYKTFNFTPEKGLPENSIELTNVVEALPCDVNQNKKLSKSLDSGFQIEDEDDFVEINLNGTPLEAGPKDLVTSTKNVTGDRTPKEGSPRHKLTLNMKNQFDKKTANKADALPPLNKYVVNCESTVYEHKGVSYSYVHDTFQTAFDAPKETFVPIPESTPVKELITSTTKVDLNPKVTETDASSRTSTPKRHFNKNVQEETEQKNGIPKHLSSPKRQNVNRYSRKSASTTTAVQKENDEQPQVNSDNCSNTDNSTLKGGEDFNDEFFDSPSNQKLQSDKSALLNRYLKNVCQRKDLELKIRNNKFFHNKLRMERGFPSIIYPFEDVSETFHISAARMSRLVDKELIENKRLSVRLLTAEEPSYFDSFEDNVAIECNEKLRLQIFSYPNETLNRVS